MTKEEFLDSVQDFLTGKNETEWEDDRVSIDGEPYKDEDENWMIDAEDSKSYYTIWLWNEEIQFDYSSTK